MDDHLGDPAKLGLKYVKYGMLFAILPNEIYRLLTLIFGFVIVVAAMILLPFVAYVAGVIIALLMQIWLINSGLMKKNILLIIVRSLLSFFWVIPAIFKYIY